MMVHRIVAHSNTSSVKRLVLFVGLGKMINSQGGDPMNASGFSMIGDQWKTIVSGKFIINQAIGVKSQFGLQIIQKL